MYTKRVLLLTVLIALILVVTLLILIIPLFLLVLLHVFVSSGSSSPILYNILPVVVLLLFLFRVLFILLHSLLSLRFESVTSLPHPPPRLPEIEPRSASPTSAQEISYICDAIDSSNSGIYSR